MPEGRVHQHLRDQRPDRVGHRRPARAGRLADRLRPRRRRRGARSPGRTSRRSCSSSAARTRSSCSRRDDLDAVVEAAVGGRLENTGQACNAAKRFIVLDDLYDAFVEKFTAALTEVEPGDPTSADTTIGPLSSTRGRGPARGPGQAGARRGRQARRRRRPRRQLLQDRRPHRHHPGQPGLHRGVLRAGRAGLQGRLRGRGGRARQRHPVRARLLRLHRPTRSRRCASPTRSRPAWCSSTRSAPRASSCRSAA